MKRTVRELTRERVETWHDDETSGLAGVEDESQVEDEMDDDEEDDDSDC